PPARTSPLPAREPRSGRQSPGAGDPPASGRTAPPPGAAFPGNPRPCPEQLVRGIGPALGAYRKRNTNPGRGRWAGRAACPPGPPLHGRDPRIGYRPVSPPRSAALDPTGGAVALPARMAHGEFRATGGVEETLGLPGRRHGPGVALGGGRAVGRRGGG